MRARILLTVVAIGALAAGVKFVRLNQDLARQQEQIQEDWARVEAAMQKRADAIPMMFVQLHVQHDPKELDAAKKALAAPGSPEQKIRANRELSLVLAKLLLACETDPLMRKLGDFKSLREELAAREDEIANARFQYNNSLEHYNARMLRFPDNVVASLAGFSRNDAYFGTGPDSALAPKTPN